MEDLPSAILLCIQMRPDSGVWGRKQPRRSLAGSVVVAGNSGVCCSAKGGAEYSASRPRTTATRLYDRIRPGFRGGRSAQNGFRSDLLSEMKSSSGFFQAPIIPLWTQTRCSLPARRETLAGSLRSRECSGRVKTTKRCPSIDRHLSGKAGTSNTILRLVASSDILLLRESLAGPSCENELFRVSIVQSQPPGSVIERAISALESR